MGAAADGVDDLRPSAFRVSGGGRSVPSPGNIWPLVAHTTERRERVGAGSSGEEKASTRPRPGAARFHVTANGVCGGSFVDGRRRAPSGELDAAPFLVHNSGIRRGGTLVGQPFVRPYRASVDFRAILDCQCDLYELNFPRFVCTNQFLHEQASRLKQAGRRPYEQAIIVLDDDGVLAGFVWMALRMDLQGVFGAVDQVYLKAAYRGRGYGAQLMEAAHRHLKGMGIDYVRLYVTHDNVSAVQLYERLGYRTIRLEMERPL